MADEKQHVQNILTLTTDVVKDIYWFFQGLEDSVKGLDLKVPGTFVNFSSLNIDRIKENLTALETTLEEYNEYLKHE